MRMIGSALKRVRVVAPDASGTGIENGRSGCTRRGRVSGATVCASMREGVSKAHVSSRAMNCGRGNEGVDIVRNSQLLG